MSHKAAKRKRGAGDAKKRRRDSLIKFLGWDDPDHIGVQVVEGPKMFGYYQPRMQMPEPTIRISTTS